MRKLTVVSATAMLAVALLVAAQGTSAIADETGGSHVALVGGSHVALVGGSHVALVGQMVFVPGDASGPDPAAVLEARQTATMPTVVKIPSGLSEEEEGLFIEKKAGELAGEAKVSDGLMTPNSTSTVTGNCGWSSVTLEDAWGTYVAYYKARFGLNRPGTTFTMNEHVWDPSFWDFSNWVWTESGNLGGGSSWFDDFTFSVDAQTTYSAELDGEVYVGDGWCMTAGAQVNDVRIY